MAVNVTETEKINKKGKFFRSKGIANSKKLSSGHATFRIYSSECEVGYTPDQFFNRQM